MTTSHVILNLNSDGTIECFCPYTDYLRGDCACRDKFDCPEAIIDIKIVTGSRPSEKITGDLNKIERELKTTVRNARQQSRKIKQGLVGLEKAVGKLRGFKI